MTRTTVSPQKSLVAGLVMLGLVVGLQRAVAQAVQCPAGGQQFTTSGTVDGVSFQVSGGTLTMTNTTTSDMATVSWCAEGKEEFSNGSKISGLMSTSIPGGQSQSSFFDKDLNHFVVYSVEHVDSGGHGPPPRPGKGNGGGGDGDGGGGDGGSGGTQSTGGSGGTLSTGGGAGGSGAVAPPPPVIVNEPTVTG